MTNDAYPEDAEHRDGGRDTRVFRLFYVFLPETSIVRRFRFQLVVTSRFLSEIGQEGVFYGALVQVAMRGSPIEASAIGVAKLLPGAVLGLLGGVVADALPRRIALGLGYAFQAGLCIVVPFMFGTGFGMLLILVLGVSTLNQLIGPSENAVLPLVSTREEISTAASVISLTDSIGSGLGTAAVAPFVLVTFGVRTLFVVCAVFLVLASIRIFALPVQRDVTVKAALERLKLTELDIGFTSALRWLLGWPAIITIIMVGMIVSVLSSITQTLAPTYVAEVLDTDPAGSVYVFAPAGAGALIALAIAPKVVDSMGERWAAAVAVLIMSAALFALAFVDHLASWFGPVNPLNIVRVFGLHPTDELLGASLISVFTGFAVSLSSVSVQTYLNRRVPSISQGRVFGLQNVLINASALLPMLLLGFIAECTSIEAILLVAPWVVLGGIYALLMLANRWVGGEPMSREQVRDSFWHEPGGPMPKVAEPRTAVS
jgi:MFS family permease